MKEITTPKAAFIRVSCEASSPSSIPLLPLKSNFYVQFHAVLIFPEATSGVNNATQSNLSHKLSYWKKRVSSGVTRLPPNILAIGIDSTSGLNFRRLMFSTVKTLNNVIKAEELKGYTKVGQNTFPNFAALLSSFSVDELRTFCNYYWLPFDDCPFIWTEFYQNKYLTAHLEDAPAMGIFNYGRPGFMVSPVDIYLRPLMLAAYRFQNRLRVVPWRVECLGYRRPEDIIWDYLVDLAEFAKTKQIPYFISSWLSDTTHDDIFGLQTLDTRLSKLLLSLHSKNLLENTVLLVMSDHGYRYLDIRRTTSGWYEDKLPAMWIKLPASITKLHPDWAKALKENSRKLVTPFDLHFALRDILDLSINMSFGRTQTKTNTNQPYLIRTAKKRATSPFKRVPDRTCEEAGVPRGYCPCAAPVAFSNKVFIELAAQFFINYINAQLPSMCKPLHVSKVTAFGTPDKKFKSHVGDPSVLGYPEISVMALTAKPGNFIFEAWLKYDKTKGNFTQVFDVLRMNSINNRASCVRPYDELSHLEIYCYCNQINIILSFLRTAF